MKLRVFVTTYPYTLPESPISYWASTQPPSSGIEDACTYEVEGEVEVPDRYEKVAGVVRGQSALSGAGGVEP